MAKKIQTVTSKIKSKNEESHLKESNLIDKDINTNEKDNYNQTHRYIFKKDIIKGFTIKEIDYSLNIFIKKEYANHIYILTPIFHIDTKIL